MSTVIDREQADVELRLLIRYHHEGDLEAREVLARRLLPFAHKLAMRYAYADESMDDLIQVASLGLLKAIDRFDPERQCKFTSFAAPTILGELKRHFRDKCWSVRAPRVLQERSLALIREIEALSKGLGRSPITRELAEALDWTTEEVLEAREAARSYEATSLDAPSLHQDPETGSLLDLIGGEDEAYELVAERDAIAGTWQKLSDVERQVLELRFRCELTQREIGEEIGYSQMHVSRVLRRAMARFDTACAA